MDLVRISQRRRAGSLQRTPIPAVHRVTLLIASTLIA